METWFTKMIPIGKISSSIQKINNIIQRSRNSNNQHGDEQNPTRLITNYLFKKSDTYENW